MFDLTPIDHAAIKRILERRGLDFRTASKIAYVHPNTIRRLAGDYVPEGMKPERVGLAQPSIVVKLAAALRVEPSISPPSCRKNGLRSARHGNLTHRARLIKRRPVIGASLGIAGAAARHS
jgi:hypothetical protein